ncbi:PASTA domain, binds beta-lactams [Streptosporangium subroseum]|uniref:PASTA domain, binds beta-lactams n=1 Tax=Streptosporangium subroseum TaxID=106412 RepID=A0A239NXJ5_9ACTN|nr:PASTA domain-containing protein [Streptosporangium subroseum]SNT59621.1 PASTA domain, binds beta-lactams [Streptosporangium subroseum]
MVRPFLILVMSLAAFISSPSPTVEEPPDGTGCSLPEVMGLSLEEAQQLLRARGIHIKLDPVDIPGMPPPFAISVSGNCDQVTLKHGVRLPDLAELTLQQATEELEGLDLASRVLSAEAGLDWTVVHQEPGAEKVVPYGTRVDLEAMAPVTSSPLVSLTPDPETPTPPRPSPKVVVPQLKGLSQASAKKKLAAVGLKLQLHPDSPRVGKIARQDPPKDRKVTRNTSVRVWLKAPPDTPQTPSPDGGLGLTGGVALAGGAALTGLLLIRRRRSRQQIRQSRPRTFAIRCVPHPDLTPRVEIHGSGSVSSPGIRVEPHADPGRQEIREVLT